MIRWADVEHCTDCGVCIADMDHHCPWTSKCIGSKNMRQFYCFVGSTLTYIVYIMAVLVLAATSLPPAKK